MHRDLCAAHGYRSCRRLFLMWVASWGRFVPFVLFASSWLLRYLGKKEVRSEKAVGLSFDRFRPLTSDFCGGNMQLRFLVRAGITLGATTMIVLLVLRVYRPLDAAAVLTAGKADLKSAGALTFGPDGVLFVGDSIGGAVVALDTNDKAPVKTAAINVQGLDQKIAALVGVMPDQILINDVAVNPIS